MRNASNRFRSFVAIGMIALGPLAAVQESSAQTKPSIAVLDFSTQGLHNYWWGSDFQPGIALSDLITNQLVNDHKFTVVERKKLDAVMAEHKLSTDGEVSPATLIQSGQLTGARYLVTGNILQFDKTGQSGGALGGFLRGTPAAGIGGIKMEKVTLRVEVHIVDATTGAIVQSVEGDKTQSSTSFSGAGVGAGAAGFGGGAYGSQDFISSTMGKLINDEAAEIADKFDPASFGGGATTTAALTGRIISADSFGIVLNIGSAKGVENGMYFNVVKERQIKDLDTGKFLTVSTPTAKLQITQVNADSAIATRISGVVAVGEKVAAAAP